MFSGKWSTLLSVFDMFSVQAFEWKNWHEPLGWTMKIDFFGICKMSLTDFYPLQLSIVNMFKKSSFYYIRWTSLPSRIVYLLPVTVIRIVILLKSTDPLVGTYTGQSVTVPLIGNHELASNFSTIRTSNCSKKEMFCKPQEHSNILWKIYRYNVRLFEDGVKWKIIPERRLLWKNANLLVYGIILNTKIFSMTIIVTIVRFLMFLLHWKWTIQVSRLVGAM